jgi:S-layer protein
VSALSADAVKTISVTGDAGFNLGYTGTTATTVDASGITKGGFTWTAGALAASSVVKGSATGTNTINLDATTTASTFVTYTGGSGNDLVDASSSNNNNVFSLLGGDNNLQSGNGNNTVTLASDGAVAVSNGATGNSITLGNGNNTVTDTGTKGAYVSVGTGSNTITLGSGNDFVTVGAAAGLNVINVGSGTDTVVIGGVQAAGGYYTSITGFGAGDVLNLAAVTATAAADAALGAKITLGANASFANYLDAAAAGTIADNGAAVIKWFQFSGNTYVVVDTETGAGVDGNTFQDGVDSVVELVGLIDLTTSATVSDVLTLA